MRNGVLFVTGVLLAAACGSPSVAAPVEMCGSPWHLSSRPASDPQIVTAGTNLTPVYPTCDGTVPIDYVGSKTRLSVVGNTDSGLYLVVYIDSDGLAQDGWVHL